MRKKTFKTLPLLNLKSLFHFYHQNEFSSCTFMHCTESWWNFIFNLPSVFWLSGKRPRSSTHATATFLSYFGVAWLSQFSKVPPFRITRSSRSSIWNKNCSLHSTKLTTKITQEWTCATFKCKLKFPAVYPYLNNCTWKIAVKTITSNYHVLLENAD